MVCSPCTDRLAYKLLGHHKQLDLLRAFELAEKAIERVENRDNKVNVQTQIKSGNPTDYTQACVATGSCYCDFDEPCVTNVDCQIGNCGCTCPAPLPNSHLVSNTCISSMSGCRCTAHGCTFGSCACRCATGQCNYDCDSGYVWNPITLQCKLALAAEKIVGDGLVFATT